MGFDGYGIGGGWFGHFIWIVVSGITTLFAFLVVAGLLFVLVRFLLVATKAAQIYVAKNSPAKPVAPVVATPGPVGPGPAAPAAAAPVAAAPKPATVVKPAAKPATKPRAPKTPPPAS